MTKTLLSAAAGLLLLCGSSFAQTVGPVDYDPCLENRALDSTAFLFILTPPNKRMPLLFTFTPESCGAYDSERAGKQALRTYRGNKGYDLVLVTTRGAASTSIHLVQRLPDGGRQVAGGFGDVPTAELLGGQVKTDRKALKDFSNNSLFEGTAELLPKPKTP